METQRTFIAKNRETALRQWAHDIRSPLLALDTFSQIADGLSQEDRQLLRGAVDRIRGLSSNLLTRPTSLAAPTEKNEPTLFDLIEQTMREKWLEVFGRPGITLETRIAPGAQRAVLSTLTGVELQRLLSNLLNNSIEAIPGYGRISISASIVENRALILIEDNGCGFSFDPALIKCGRLATTKINGNGLGLSHAFALVEECGGNLRIESQRGHGTQVYLELPVRRA